MTSASSPGKVFQWDAHFDFPRNLIGYGPSPPVANWPNKAKIAISFVINYEEGGENCVLNGDPKSEASLWENSASYVAKVGERAVNVESEYEYGSRVGVWRIMKLFEKMGFKWTLYAVGKAIEENPEAALRTIRSGGEVASHAYRWIDHHAMSPDEEKAMIRNGIEAIKNVTGKPPVGWYYGRLSPRSRALVWDVFDAMGLPLLWQSDTYCDDLPFWTDVPAELALHRAGKIEEPHGMLMIPYSYDCNDFKFHTPTGFGGPGDFYQHLKNAFDTLYEEGVEDGLPKMMTVGLHCRIIGKPGRFAELKRFCEYVASREEVWVATREEIAQHWRAMRPYQVGRL